MVGPRRPVGLRTGPGRAVCALALGMVMLLPAACTSSGGRVATLRELPILQPPDGAEEIGRIEAEGTSVGTGSPARVEVVWGVEDGLATAEAHVEEFERAWGLRPTVDGEWSGARPIEGEPVAAYLRTWDDLDEVGWDSVVIDRTELDPWAGPIVVVRLSSP